MAASDVWLDTRTLTLVLDIRTFAILPMGKRWGVIEWIDNLASLKSIVNNYWEAIGNPTVPVSCCATMLFATFWLT